MPRSGLFICRYIVDVVDLVAICPRKISLIEECLDLSDNGMRLIVLGIMLKISYHLFLSVISILAIRPRTCQYTKQYDNYCPMKFETCDEHEKEEYQKTSKYGLVGISKAS